MSQKRKQKVQIIGTIWHTKAFLYCSHCRIATWNKMKCILSVYSCKTGATILGRVTPISALSFQRVLTGVTLQRIAKPFATCSQVLLSSFSSISTILFWIIWTSFLRWSQLDRDHVGQLMTLDFPTTNQVRYEMTSRSQIWLLYPHSEEAAWQSYIANLLWLWDNIIKPIQNKGKAFSCHFLSCSASSFTSMLVPHPNITNSRCDGKL